MEKKYYVSNWALRRQAELMDLPQNFSIHSDYLKVLSRQEITAALQCIRQFMHRVFGDISDNPGSFKMPMVEIRSDNLTKYGFPPAAAQSSKRAPYMLLDALINVLVCGTLQNGELTADSHRLAESNKTCRLTEYKAYSPKSYSIKNVPALYARLEDYGFFWQGLNNYRLTKEPVTLSYPESSNVLTVLKWMADKSDRYMRRQEFMVCNYRLLEHDMSTMGFGEDADYIFDKMHTDSEREIVNKLDAALRDKGLIPHVDNRSELPGEDSYAVFYYTRERDFTSRSRSCYKLSSKSTVLHLALRIDNIQNCTELIKGCSQNVKSIFIPGDTGCAQRPHCTHGQAYIIEGKEYWRCGCCGKMLEFIPCLEDISDYIKLVDIGLLRK